MLLKIAEYEEKEAICAEGRKSYYKTDRDATAMCFKSDYYSGLGSNMHAAYNVQYLVCRGIVAAYSVTQSRADSNDFIGVVESFRRNYGRYPANVCADAKVFEANVAFLGMKAEAERNLLSPKGIELRVNRSIQVEGAFGIEKGDYGYERLRRRPGILVAASRPRGPEVQEAFGEAAVQKGKEGPH